MIEQINKEFKEILKKMNIRKDRIKRVDNLYKNFEKSLKYKNRSSYKVAKLETEM